MTQLAGKKLSGHGAYDCTQQLLRIEVECKCSAQKSVPETSPVPPGVSCLIVYFQELKFIQEKAGIFQNKCAQAWNYGPSWGSLGQGLTAL